MLPSPEGSILDGDIFKGDRYQLDTLEGPSGGLLHPQLRKHRVQLVDAPKMALAAFLSGCSRGLLLIRSKT